VPLTAIKKALSEDSTVRSYKIKVVQLADAIVIQGAVRSYYQKQIACQRVLRLLQNQGMSLQVRDEITVISDLQSVESEIP
jgi:hypothetical protein